MNNLSRMFDEFLDAAKAAKNFDAEADIAPWEHMCDLAVAIAGREVLDFIDGEQSDEEMWQLLIAGVTESYISTIKVKREV